MHEDREEDRQVLLRNEGWEVLLQADETNLRQVLLRRTVSPDLRGFDRRTEIRDSTAPNPNRTMETNPSRDGFASERIGNYILISISRNGNYI